VALRWVTAVIVVVAACLLFSTRAVIPYSLHKVCARMDLPICDYQSPLSLAATLDVPAQITYDNHQACIGKYAYVNDVLPREVGEFSERGFDRSYWSAKKVRTIGENAETWGPGFQTSWGRHQYDTYFADRSDGLNLDPFSMEVDRNAKGAPRALRITADVLPAGVARSLVTLANDQWQVTTATAPFRIPNEGGTIQVDVLNPNAAQNGWRIGVGYQGAPVAFVGRLTSGGAKPSGDGSGGSSPWTISDIHVYAGAPGTMVQPNDEGGLRAYHFVDYWSGVLDTNLNQQYGFFVARLRLPPYLPGLSPAFWTLETGGVARDRDHNLIRNELDIMEMFGNTSGNALNTNEIAWNQSWKAGVGVSRFPSGDPQQAYHDYGVLQKPGVTSFYIDGKPVAGNVNLPDWTQGSADKELMLMIQVGAPGSWLDPKGKGMSNPWPQYLWSQWIRVYRPTKIACRT